MFGRFLKDEGGATAIEYSLIGVFVSIAIVSAMYALTNEVGLMFNNVSNEIKP